MDPDELYGLALDRFIPERGALVKALRAEQRRDEAAAVAALRKPAVAAWAVNQVMRSQPAGVQALFAAGDELRDAQARLLAGSGDGRALRAANEREREAVDELVRAARGLLSSQGHELSAAVVDRVADTLHAAALDEAAREQVREGRLERELRHIGLGLGESADPFAVAPPPAKARAKPAPDQASTPAPATAKQQPGTRASAASSAEQPPAARSSSEQRRAAREQATREREERARLERERAEARKAARTAEAAAKRRAERAGHALKAAEQRRERAAQALAKADEALTAAQAEAQEAVAAQQQAQAELDAL
jgi:hypothetical protein